MLIIKLLLGLAITIAVLYGVYRVHLHLKGGSTGSGLVWAGIRKARGQQTGDLERFIADYRAQQSPALAAQIIDSTPDHTLGVSLHGAAARPVLEGPQRLIFLLLKTSLPAYHVLPRPRWSDFAKHPPGELALQRVDFLVCDRNFTPVSVIVINNGPHSPPDGIPGKALADEMGLRYVAMDAAALPRRQQVPLLVLGKAD